MKIVKILLIFVLTLFWVVLSFVLYRTSATYIPIAVVTSIYGLLIYLVWPIGTNFTEEAAKRFLIVMGAGVFLVVLNVLISNECPDFPNYVWIQSRYQSVYLALITLTCSYLGKYPTALLLSCIGSYIIYMGLTLKFQKGRIKLRPLFRR